LLRLPLQDVGRGGDYDRVHTPEEALTAETEEVCFALTEAVQKRLLYAIPEPSPASGGGAPKFVPASRDDPFTSLPARCCRQAATCLPCALA